MPFLRGKREKGIASVHRGFRKMCFWDKGKYQENPVKSRDSAISQIPKNQIIFEETLFLGIQWRFWETRFHFWGKDVFWDETLLLGTLLGTVFCFWEKGG